jgi:hypothetical protein
MNTFSDIQKSLVTIDVPYVGLDTKQYIGHLVVHTSIAEEVKEIFAEIATSGFPIAKIRPISEYDWDDETSMRDNNTSAFNYRAIQGTETLSNHSRGLAIDINPLFNPCMAIDGTIQPATGIYDPARPGTILPDSEVVRIFTSRGWRWLGYRDRKDWQHFDKADAA